MGWILGKEIIKNEFLKGDYVSFTIYKDKEEIYQKEYGEISKIYLGKNLYEVECPTRFRTLRFEEMTLEYRP